MDLCENQAAAPRKSSIEEGEIKAQNDPDVARLENNNESPRTFPSKYSIPKKSQTTDNANDKSSSETPTEACKLFVGGLTTNTTEAMLRDFYSTFGQVVDVVVMIDSPTGRSRCFGFVTFAEPEDADRAIAAKPHVVDNRAIDAKRAIPREVSASNPEMKVQTTRLFVPGVRDEHNEENLQAYFEKYGKVKSVVIRRDKLCAFVDFEDADPVTKCAQRAHYIEGHRCDVKKALSRDELTAARQRDRDRSYRSERSRGGALGGRGGGGGYGGRDRDGGRSGGHTRGHDWRSDRNQQRGNYQQLDYANNNAGYGSGCTPCSSRNGGDYGSWKDTRGYDSYGNQSGAYFSGPQVQRQQENVAVPPGYNGPITHIYQASFASQSSPGGGASRGFWANPTQNQNQQGDFAARPVYQPQYRPYPD